MVMASVVPTVQSFVFASSSSFNPGLQKLIPFPNTSIPIKPFMGLRRRRRRSLSSLQPPHHLCRASLEQGAPSELVEDSKFVPLNPDDPQYGPPALLLLGFDLEETTKIQELLKDLDGEFLKIIQCTEDMISRSLWEAIHTQQPKLENVKIAKSLPRICFLSGLTGEEITMFIDAFPESGLDPAVFAALVPNNADKLLKELIDEIMEDHKMVTAKEAGSS